jgi:hypothetical protein
MSEPHSPIALIPVTLRRSDRRRWLDLVCVEVSS